MPLWFEQGDYPAKIALYQELRSRNEGIWRFVRDADGVEGILIADGAVWYFGCGGCPEMITQPPVSPQDFLNEHATASHPRPAAGIATRWEDITAHAAHRLLELGFTPSSSRGSEAREVDAERTQQEATPHGLGKAWDLVLRGVALGMLLREEIPELIAHLREGRDYRVQDLSFAFLAGTLEVELGGVSDQVDAAGLTAALQAWLETSKR